MSEDGGARGSQVGPRETPGQEAPHPGAQALHKQRDTRKLLTSVLSSNHVREPTCDLKSASPRPLAPHDVSTMMMALGINLALGKVAS